ncbi:DUF4935 domain-containing protein [Chryseobacterium sp. C-2]|uniref:DUF4935 domain-containing protein n=1 Tax=Chryseobacterium muglaense TaxID=2893752 RepID=A0ABR8M813_9FLAO|nr:DUF4935 domain-containing protein [Chryseobacterium muglaense]
MDALIFIDTNILLDFYRFQNETSLKYLAEINSHKELIILTNQVEMEFKKNRQKVLLESISNIKKKTEIPSSYPSILREEESVKKIRALKEDLENEQQILVDTINKIFKNPEINDQVYIFLDPPAGASVTLVPIVNKYEDHKRDACASKRPEAIPVFFATLNLT